MKKYSIAVLLIWFLLLCDAVPVLADSPCSQEGLSEVVQGFVSSLNSKIMAKDDIGQFEVIPIKQGDVITRWSVTYRLSGRAIFTQDVGNLDVVHEGVRYVIASKFNGHSSLVFIDRFGNRGSVGCALAVFPKAGPFTVLEIPYTSYPPEIADFDHDNNTEILVHEPEEWSWDCLSGAGITFWPRIFRLDPQSGKLVDISKQFPEVYKDELKEYQARYKRLMEEKLLSPECLTHYSQFLERLQQSSVKTNIEWDALNKEVEDLYKAGQYDRAVGVAKKALELAEKNVGPDHPDVATSLSNLTRLYFAQGQYAQAEPLARRTLAICEKTLGPDHPDVAASLTNLAAIYRKQGQYSQAEPLARRALAIREKTLGPDHPDVAASLNNLAAIYHLQKQYSQAEPLFKRALEIWKKALGPDHPTVVTARKNMAALYPVTKREQEAERLEQRAARNSAGENEDKVRTFDIKGIRLGMSLNDVKQVFPQFGLRKGWGEDDWSDAAWIQSKQKNQITRYAGCGDTGGAAISDWSVCVNITDEPYGNGAYFISYKKVFYEKKDPSLYIDNFRNELIAKYGKPTYEDRIQSKTVMPFQVSGESYFACWGRNCDKNINKFDLHSTGGQFSVINNNQIQDGSYLVASFNDSLIQEVKLTLFDTNPYSVQNREENKKKLKKAQEKLGF